MDIVCALWANRSYSPSLESQWEIKVATWGLRFVRGVLMVLALKKSPWAGAGEKKL